MIVLTGEGYVDLEKSWWDLGLIFVKIPARR